LDEVLQRKKGSRKKYSAELRTFAFTLNFYSPKAYRCVRQRFKNLLPDQSNIRKWYSVLNGRPGFTEESYHALKTKVCATKDPVFCNLVLDEVAIRQSIVYDGQRFFGHVDLGIEASCDTENPREATSALVFMLVTLNGHWKVPIGYFLIDSLSGKERSNLLSKCLELVHETGVQVHSLTFDGASVNFNMCTNFGANF